MTDHLDDDIQNAGDVVRDERDDYIDYGFGIPFPPRESDIC